MCNAPVCYIFGSAPVNSSNLEEKPVKGDLIIAADGGYEAVKLLGLEPDVILGDFDSLDGGMLSDFPQKTEIVLLPVEKDDTDTVAAVKVGLEKGYKLFRLFGCLGGERFDHSIATLQTLGFIAENGGRGFAYDENHTVTAVKNGELTLCENEEKIFSVFALSGKCSGVSLKDVKYPLTNAELSPTFPLGVSNSIIPGKEAKISVKNGILLVVKSK